MAKAQQQGVGAIKVWLIVFAAAWLASMVLLVMLYTGQEELRTEADRARAARARLASADEEGRVPLVRQATEGGPTAVGLLEEARGRIAHLATGDEQHDVATVRTKRDEMLLQIRREGVVDQPEDYNDLSLHDALTRLYAALGTENELRQAAEKRRDELSDEVAALAQSVADQKNDFHQRAQTLSEQVAEAEEDRDRYRTERDGAVADLEAEFENRRAQTDADLTQERKRRALAEQRLTDMQKRVARQQEKFGELATGPEQRATVRRPDGKILMAVPGDDVVYVDLGRGDRLMLGLRFAVYASQGGIPADGRAKAQIEVVSIAASSAECKIVRLARNEVVLEGDLVANPIYDPARAPSFLVMGAFDLDHDGTPDRSGAATIESLIKNWGGELVTDLTALTDFVVLGLAPPRPVAVTDPTAEQATAAASKRRLWDAHQEALATANSLSVPVLTQEVFLSFLGYSSRLAGR